MLRVVNDIKKTTYLCDDTLYVIPQNCTLLVYTKQNYNNSNTIQSKTTAMLQNDITHVLQVCLKPENDKLK